MVEGSSNKGYPHASWFKHSMRFRDADGSVSTSTMFFPCDLSMLSAPTNTPADFIS